MEAAILLAGQGAVERRLLEDDADAAADLRLVVGQVGASDLHAPRGRGKGGGQDADRGGLPRTVWSEEGEEGALLD